MERILTGYHSKNDSFLISLIPRLYIPSKTARGRREREELAFLLASFTPGSLCRVAGDFLASLSHGKIECELLSVFENSETIRTPWLKNASSRLKEDESVAAEKIFSILTIVF